MAQQSKKPNLADMSAAEYLVFLGRNYTAQARVAGNPESSSIDVSAAFVPMDSSNLEFSARGSAGLDRPKMGSLSVGNKLFNLSRKYEDSLLGSTTTDTGEVDFGPVKGYYQQSSQPDNQDLQNKSFGANVNLGPVKLFADRTMSSQDVIPSNFVKYFDSTLSDNKTDTLGGSVGIGPVNVNLSREFGTSRGPKSKFEDTRPMAQSPNVTRFGGGYEGKVGPGILGVGGSLTDVRGVGTESSLGGSYNVNDPFGFGGELSATGSYNNPIGGESAAQALINYRMKF
tara:strand:- start:470 stop:1324 length:855 start_codon:yes stop_codon:yes gene_type:complete